MANKKNDPNHLGPGPDGVEKLGHRYGRPERNRFWAI